MKATLLLLFAFTLIAKLSDGQNAVESSLPMSSAKNVQRQTLSSIQVQSAIQTTTGVHKRMTVPLPIATVSVGDGIKEENVPALEISGNKPASNQIPKSEFRDKHPDK